MESALARKNETSLKNSHSVSSLFEQYVDYLDVQSDETLRTYVSGVRHFAKYLKDNGNDRPNRETIIEYKNFLAVTHKPTTCRIYLESVKLFFQWCEQEGFYTDIAKHVKAPKLSEGHLRDCLTAEQIRTCLDTIDTSSIQGKRDYAIFALMATCGLRDCEVMRANIEDIRNVGGQTVIFVQGKGRTEKTDFIPLSACVEKAIRSYISARESYKDNSPLFVSLSNNSIAKRLSTRSVSGTVKKIMKTAGYDSSRLTAHSLRHSAVTLALLDGNDLQTVQAFARHASLNTTMIYAHNLDKMNNRCSQSVSDCIFNA